MLVDEFVLSLPFSVYVVLESFRYCALPWMDTFLFRAFALSHKIAKIWSFGSAFERKQRFENVQTPFLCSRTLGAFSCTILKPNYVSRSRNHKCMLPRLSALNNKIPWIPTENKSKPWLSLFSLYLYSLVNLLLITVLVILSVFYHDSAFKFQVSILPYLLSTNLKAWATVKPQYLFKLIVLVLLLLLKVTFLLPPPTSKGNCSLFFFPKPFLCCLKSTCFLFFLIYGTE